MFATTSDAVSLPAVLLQILAYCVGSKARLGQRPRKRALDIEVRSRDGSDSAVGGAIVRSTTRLVRASSILLGLIGVVLIADSRHDRRLGDMAGGRVVVDADRRT